MGVTAGIRRHIFGQIIIDVICVAWYGPSGCDAFD